MIISMLGEFSVAYGDNIISEQTKRSKKLWPMLEYLITFHDRGISQNELIELLWGDEESDNPCGALKTQMHRLRAMLAELNCPDNVIISVNGSYAFNTDIEYEIDVEKFETAFKAAADAPNDDEKLNCYLRAIDLYTGDFLAKSAYESWVVPINTYYRSVYTKAVHCAIEMLLTRGKPHDIAAICNKAIQIDPYDEYVHYHLIKVLAELGEQESAKRQYEYITNLLYTKFGVSPSQQMMELYEQTVKTKKNIEMNLDVVEKNLLEEQKVSGAFFCEYQIFKHLYQLELREALRTHININICLLTITDGEDGIPPQGKLNKAMERLMGCISSSLRGSDVYARYSVSQYIVMLPNTNETTGQMVLKRIEKNFKHENTNKDIVFHFQFKAASRSEGANEA